MKIKYILSILIIAFLIPASVFPEGKDIKLPAPETGGGKPFMTVLKNRKTTRSFSPNEVPVQVLSNLLWAASGVSHEKGKRTAPSAMDNREIEIYVAKAEGLYLYLPDKHMLKLVLEKDIRGDTGKQGFVKNAPVNLVYVADFSRMKMIPNDDKIIYAAADTGFISQNVYLFCASEGLNTVVRGWVNKQKLASIMMLKSGQKIILSQTIGYPKK